MELPFGKIRNQILEMDFSSADYSVASVLSAIREHLDMIQEMKVVFLGVSTEVIAGPTPVFRPVPIRAVFEFVGTGNPTPVLERVYQVVWQGIALTFPSEEEWAAAKRDFSAFISSQAELLRARLEGSANT